MSTAITSMMKRVGGSRDNPVVMHKAVRGGRDDGGRLKKKYETQGGNSQGIKVTTNNFTSSLYMRHRRKSSVKLTKIKIKESFWNQRIREQTARGRTFRQNGAGKTSVIDAIRLALTNRSDREYIVRDGETEGKF